MPYSGKDDPDLPSNVKKMGDKDKAQWVSIFNDSLSSCTKKGGSEKVCETKAFKTANGVMKKKNAFEQLQEWFHNLFSPEEDYEDRSIAFSGIYNQVATMMYSRDDESGEHGWLLDVYADDDKSMFAISSRGGKLYKTKFDVDSDSHISLGDEIEVVTQFKEVSTSVKLMRQANGRVRFMQSACTSVLNRMGMIDSRELFDKFIERVKEYGYPYATFFHAGEKMRMGVCDFVARDENVLILSGVFDDTELGQLMPNAIEKDPEYWGSSISFMALSSPKLVELADDVRIPVYTDGYLEETSFLPEEYACSLLTRSLTTSEKENRMDKRILDALVKLCDGDEEKAKKFAESIDGVNRTIADEKLVTRSEEPPVEQVAPIAVEPTTESFVFDDSMIVRVVQVLGEDPGFKTLVTSSYQVPVDLTPRVVSLESQDVSRSSKLAELETRLAKLEKPEEDKKKEWASEISEKTLRNIRVIYRPSEASPQGETSGEKEKMEEIASSTVSLIKT